MLANIIVIIVLISSIRLVELYPYVIIEEGEKLNRCKNMTCEGGELHSICYKENRHSADCRGYKVLKITHERKVMLINGHNGIRNKIANMWRISNMLLLHWDPDLEKMAKGYLTRCKIAKDPCNFILNDTLTVSQTYFYSPKLPLNRFVISIMRSWFLEINKISTFAEFISQKPKNMTVLNFPASQFMGCAAAEMFGGHMMTCYYSPATVSKRIYDRGEPCSSCPEIRSSCSRLFPGLCGKDLKIYGKGTILCIDKIVVLVLVLNTLYNMQRNFI